MHAVRGEIHTARHWRVVRFDHLYVFECTKTNKATKQFALSNRAVGRQFAHYLFDGAGELGQAAVPIRVFKQKTTLEADFQHPLLHLSQVRWGI